MPCCPHSLLHWPWEMCPLSLGEFGIFSSSVPSGVTQLPFFLQMAVFSACRRRDLNRAVTSLLAERAFKSVPNSCTFTPKPVYYNYYPVLAAVGKKNTFLQHRLKKTCEDFLLALIIFLSSLPMEIMWKIDAVKMSLSDLMIIYIYSFFF